MTTMRLIRTVPPEAQSRLYLLAAELRAMNPDCPVSVDEGAVWIELAGTEFGIYSYAITGEIVRCYEGGSTPLHRPAQGASYEH